MQKFKVSFEDEYLLLIDKPPGITVDKSETQSDETVEDLLLRSHLGQGATLYRSGIVHRLDKDTSGLLLVAKTPKALENLQRQFQERAVKKEYLALVHGILDSVGRVEGAVGRNPKNREKFTVVSTGKQAVTEYEPLRQYQISNIKYQNLFLDFNKIQMRKLERMKYNQFTLLLCKPLTGRTHQIRVHLKYIGHPVVADEKYVGRKMYRLDKRWCPRMFLHARKIGFRHPASLELMEFESKLPEDLEKALWKTFSYSLP